MKDKITQIRVFLISIYILFIGGIVMNLKGIYSFLRISFFEEFRFWMIFLVVGIGFSFMYINYLLNDLEEKKENNNELI